MAFENFEEVWAALGRLHDSILAESEQRKAAVKKIDEQLAQLAAMAMRHEERFDAMTERFDAMTGQFDAMTGQFGAMNGRFDAMTERVDRVVSTVATIAGTVAQLAITVESHERRLGRIEGQ